MKSIPFRLMLVIAAMAVGASAADRLVDIPSTTYQAADQATGVQVTVTLGKFRMAPAETTQREFEQVMGYNPSFHKGPDLPVENVNWWEAIRYANLRSILEGLEPCYSLASGHCDLRKNGYRLPTDAEWSYAAGTLPSPSSPNILQSANLGTADTKNVGRLVENLKASGTKPARSYPAGQFGLYDMWGNVWEWSNDYFNPELTPDSGYDPAGPRSGLARILRGGSFVSTTSGWARGYRSSMEPEYRSRFTGFRVCQTVEYQPTIGPAHARAEWFEPYNQAPAGHERSTGGLSSLVDSAQTVDEWQNRRRAIAAKWEKLLGNMEIAPPAPAVRIAEKVNGPNYEGRLMYLQVEPDWWEKILIMRPAGAGKRPLPVVIVPYYDVDTPVGRNLLGRSSTPISVRSFAYMAVQQGYIAVAIRWFGESYGESSTEAVANLKLRHPHATGLGKWVWDAHRLVDYLYTLPDVDRANIGIIGHSLGAKMATYAAAFDDRITAVVASEGGIGLAFSNYDDYWYFGDFIRAVDPGTDQHELLGLIAPRPFLLIGGDEYDTAKSWWYINAARQVYGLYGKPRNIGYFNHHKGHTPTPEAVWRSMEWLRHFLGPGE